MGCKIKFRIGLIGLTTYHDRKTPEFQYQWRLTNQEDIESQENLSEVFQMGPKHVYKQV